MTISKGQDQTVAMVQLPKNSNVEQYGDTPGRLSPVYLSLPGCFLLSFMQGYERQYIWCDHIYEGRVGLAKLPVPPGLQSGDHLWLPGMVKMADTPLERQSPSIYNTGTRGP